MMREWILMLSLFAVSVAFASEPKQWITFSQDADWSVFIAGDGSARFSYGSSDSIGTPPGSFDLKAIDAALGPLVTTDPGLERGASVYSSLRTGQVVKDHYYTENLEYLRSLLEEVFEKSWIRAGDVERFQKWLETAPPMGVELYFEEKQIRREGYAGPPIRLRKPPPWFTTAAKQYPVLGKVPPVVLELFSTPWPYVALIVLLGMVVRRWRGKKPVPS